MGTKKDGSFSGKEVRVWCTPSLVIQGVFLSIAITIIAAFFVIWGVQNRSIEISCCFGVAWLVFAIGMGSLRHEMFAAVILQKDGISFPSASKKHEFVPYKQYSHVYLGYYLHGFSGFAKPYIVLSQRYIPANQLARVNELAQTTTVVKFRFSKRRFNLLRELLPVRHRLMLERECAGMTAIQ
jgi:hypothetical protein